MSKVYSILFFILFSSCKMNKDGSVTEPKIIRSVEASLGNEALRIIGLMPKWKLGKQNEKVLKVRYTFPIKFKIDNP